MRKKRFTVWMVASLLVLVFQIPVWAAYPEKSLNILVWSTPGSGNDIAARSLATMSEKSFGQPIQIVNKTGGSGVVAMSYLLSRPADGQWCVLNTNSMISVLYDTPQSYNLDSFDYVIRLMTDPEFIAVRKESPYKTIEDLLQAAKKRPGELKMGGSLMGSIAWLVAKHIEKVADVKFNYIPYPGARDAVVAVLGGHLDVIVSPMAPMMGVFKSGDMRLLARTSTESETDVKVPTFVEKKMPSVDQVMSRGIMVKKETSPEIIEKLHSAFKKTILSPEWKAQYLDKYQQYQGYQGPTAFTKAMQDEAKITIPLLQSIPKGKQ
jgi:putative tricarboxylic transport membrane protein